LPKGRIKIICTIFFLDYEQQQSLKLLHQNNYNNNISSNQEYLSFIQNNHHRHDYSHREPQQHLRKASLDIKPMLRLPSNLLVTDQTVKTSPACLRMFPLDYCTLRPGKQNKEVQFADMQLDLKKPDVSINIK
jgi:hypothetical protein